MLPANNLIEYFEELAQSGWTFIPVDPAWARQLFEAAEERAREHSFKRAAVSSRPASSPDIRSDSTFWLEHAGQSHTAVEADTLRMLHYLRTELRTFFRISLNDLECHYSIYQPDEFYRRHRDTTAHSNKRQFSFVIYLNSNWRSEDGGELVGYQDNTILFRASPRIGHMILFRSDLEHEVLPPKRIRYSLTGWFRT